MDDYLTIIIIFIAGYLLLRICIAPLRKKQKLTDKELQRAQAFQKDLEEQFLNSSLTRQIIEAISDDTGRLPEEITVFDSRVTGRTNSQMRDFDFAANRVPFLDGLYTIEGEYVKSAHNPKEALARAINLILGEQYNIEHSGTDHVLLRLKATNYW
ncbi:MAG: hypothetical protein U0M99_05590 [Oscillospiraceae bacterium]|nr:hypothetical protein [Oscillibacter sp.]